MPAAEELPNPGGRGMTDTEGSEETLSRRKIFKKAVAAAAAGAAGGSVLMEAIGSPASAASLSSVPAGQTTTFKSGVAPAVVFLTDAATIAVDAARGNDFRVTIHANRNMGNPSHPTDGQKIVFQITQGAGGSHTISWGTLYEFASSLPRPTLSTMAGHTDLLGFIYNEAKRRWLLVAFVYGFS